MNSRNKRHISKSRKINPRYWIFCEGETEEAFVCYLRSKYRISIEIIPKISGAKITQKFITNHKKGKPVHEKDIDFLLYDADDPNTLLRLKEINAKLLLSNPCIELWFLLHYKNQTASLSSQDCLRELRNRNRTYAKGVIDNKLKEKLDNKVEDACKRAQKLELNKNPSSNIFEFIEMLKTIKSE
ncbi:RloB family protein [Odoribacter sp. OttesenSCG-928-L07]|nr:RloB family protein [Odoribacter sp. OttesenSCG-928-L07]MDL2239246.1 RloB family protein [Bacteroidales bacterium OttesenSCG-928-L14]MDL2240413.1 RloB family protein [Bacteroidales bacterium OttesenSCG-928-K22]